MLALPPPPTHAIEREGDVHAGEPFLRVRRERFHLRFEDGTTSAAFVYDTVDRERLDAVVIAAHYADADGTRFVFVRSAIRPPIATRPHEIAGHDRSEAEARGALWELPAGLVEVEERSVDGLRACAARELGEELGLDVTPDALAPLGPPSFPAPGMVGERHFYFAVEVDPRTRATPSEDGSPLERHAAVIARPLQDLLAIARAGGLSDAKTEMGLRRLAEVV